MSVNWLPLTVTSVLQTSAGRMVFGKYNQSVTNSPAAI